MIIFMKKVYQHMAIFFNFSPTSSHLYSLQVENCDSNSRLVEMKVTMVNSGLKGLISNGSQNYFEIEYFLDSLFNVYHKSKY